MSNYLRESEASIKDKSESWPWGCAGGRVLDQLWKASSSSGSSAGLLWMLDGPPGSMSLVETGRRRQCSKLTKDYQIKRCPFPVFFIEFLSLGIYFKQNILPKLQAVI